MRKTSTLGLDSEIMYPISRPEAVASSQELEDVEQIWVEYLRRFHGRKAFEEIFVAQAKQLSQIRMLDISLGNCEVHTYNNDDEIITALSAEDPDDTLLRIIEVTELRDGNAEYKHGPPTINLSTDALKSLSAKLNMDPLFFLWNAPQPPFIGDHDGGIHSYINATNTLQRERNSAFIAQTIPKATLLESKYIYTLDREFKPGLPENSLQHGVPYRFFFTVNQKNAVIVVFPYMGCQDKPIDLASSSRFGWDGIIGDHTSALPTSMKLLVYYLQMTLEDVTIGWSGSTSWFSKKIGIAIRETAKDPEYTVDELTNLSLEGFKCLDMAISLRQWSQIIEGYATDVDGKLFLKDGWIRVNRRFEMIIQKHQLLEKQMANAHAMISARISLQDVKQMNGLAYLGALFLPGAFLAAFFGMNLNSINDSPLPLWLFFATAIPATISTLIGVIYGQRILYAILEFIYYLSSKWESIKGSFKKRIAKQMLKSPSMA